MQVDPTVTTICLLPIDIHRLAAMLRDKLLDFFARISAPSPSNEHWVILYLVSDLQGFQTRRPPQSVFHDLFRISRRTGNNNIIDNYQPVIYHLDACIQKITNCHNDYHDYHVGGPHHDKSSNMAVMTSHARQKHTLN